MSLPWLIPSLLATTPATFGALESLAHGSSSAEWSSAIAWQYAWLLPSMLAFYKVSSTILGHDLSS